MLASNDELVDMNVFQNEVGLRLKQAESVPVPMNPDVEDHSKVFHYFFSIFCIELKGNTLSGKTFLGAFICLAKIPALRK